MDATNLPWASLYEDHEIAKVQSLLDQKPNGWKNELEEIVYREIEVHEMCDNWIKADVLRDFLAGL